MKISLLRDVGREFFDEAVDDVHWAHLAKLMTEKDDLAVGKWLREHFEAMAEEAEEKLS